MWEHEQEKQGCDAMLSGSETLRSRQKTELEVTEMLSFLDGQHQE